MSNSKRFNGGQAMPCKRVEPVSRAIAVLLRRLRLKLGLSMSEVASRARVSRQMISFIERVKRVPTLDLLSRLCEALDANLESLIKRAVRLADAVLKARCAREL